MRSRRLQSPSSRLPALVPRLRMRRYELPTRVGRVRLRNPVMTASGTAGHGAELAAYMDLSTLGAVVVKSLSPRPWEGNLAPRLHPLPCGMLNSVGLQNPGIETWLEEELPALSRAGAAVVVSVWGRDPGDFEKAGALLASAVGLGGPASSMVAVEANISCPNLEDGSRMFAHSLEGTAQAVGALLRGLDGALPVWAKLSPNVTDLPAIAGASLGAGAEAVTLVNTLKGLALDPVTGRPLLGGGGGGLSGAALHPVAVRAVYECREAHPVASIVGVGGVSCGRDAAELLAAGADAVQVGTATFADPRAPARVLAELLRWCRRNGVRDLSDLKGRAHGGSGAHGPAPRWPAGHAAGAGAPDGPR